MSRLLAGPLVAAALLLPAAALAEPAVIARFEAVARAEPSEAAAPLQTLVEGTAVTVSEEGRDGWRRVRLAGGAVGWIEERALAFPARSGLAGPTAAQAALPGLAAPPPPPPAPDLRARIYVKDLDHLAELVKNDPAAGPMARKLATRRTAAYTVGGIGLAVSAAFVVYAVSEAGRHSDVNDPQFGRPGNAGAAMTGAALTSLATVVAVAAVAPWRSDLLDVINTWNVAHPEQPFTISEHGGVDR